MVITVLEAKVEPEHQPTLIDAYLSGIKNLDPGIVETFLVSRADDRTMWQIITVWESQAALDSVRDSGTPPRGVLMFKDAGASPRLTIVSVEATAHS